jgi:hypothetical protein
MFDFSKRDYQFPAIAAQVAPVSGLQPSLFEQPSGYLNQSLLELAMQLCRSPRRGLLRLGFTGDDYQRYSKTQLFPGFYIAAKTTVVNGEETAIVVVVMSGTTTLGHWVSDVNVLKSDYLGYKVHRGFMEYADSVYSALVKYLNTRTDLPENRKLLLTGHSAGGAAANLLAARLDEEQTIAKKEDIYAYTFACPNVLFGTKSDATAYNNIFNVFNTLDIVPYVPSGFSDGENSWRKFGLLLSFSSGNELDPHSHAVYLRYVQFAQFTDEEPSFSLGFGVNWLKERLNAARRGS